MNLLFDEWIPVVPSDGKPRIAPWQVTANGCYVQAVKSVRPDFDAALLHFLIGLYQYAFFEPDEGAWVDRFFSPPSPDEVKARFIELDITSAFELLGEGSRFMQEPSIGFDSSSAPVDIGHLLIDYPRRTKIKAGDDLLSRHKPDRRMCHTCCAAALYAKQSFTGYGGVGHLSSIHNGTPMLTILQGQNLWQTVWLNVLSAETSPVRSTVDHIDKLDVFPWLRDTLGEWVGKQNAPAHYYDANRTEDFYRFYWTMPERVRLGDEAEQGICFLCGNQGSTIGDYHDDSFGINYRGYWPHPLVPSLLTQPRNEDISTSDEEADHEQFDEKSPRLKSDWSPNGSLVGLRLGTYTYLDWLGLSLSDWRHDKNRIRPARVVSTYIGSRAEEINSSTIFTNQNHDQNKISLWVAGYVYDTNKQLCHQFINVQVPIVAVQGDADGAPMQALFERAARGMADDANIIAISLNGKLAKIVGSESGKIAMQEFATRTDSEFYRLIGEAARDPIGYGRDWAGHEARCGAKGWRNYLSRHAVALFDSTVDLMQITNPTDIAVAVKARRSIEKLGTVKPRKDKKSRAIKKANPKGGDLSGE